MIRATALIGALLAAAPAAAETVLVRSAEHIGFTRLVIDFRDRPEWEIDREDGVARMVPARATTFDLRDIYRRIGKTRVERVWQDGDGALAIALSCSCRIDTFELPNEGLVLDIREGTPDEDRAEDADDPVLPRDWTIVTPPHQPLLPGLLQAAVAPESDAARRRQRVDEARAEVSRMLARGAAQGLVDASSPLPELRQEPEPEPEALPEPEPESLATLYPNLRIETQIDRDNPARKAMSGISSCIDPQLSALENWGSEDLFRDGLRLDRAGLVNEAGGADPKAHTELIRTYLYLGFGAEAAGLLRSGPQDLPGHALMGDMAKAVDGPASAPLLASQTGCPSTAGLLALLVDGASMPGDLQPALARFAGFPQHLRRHIGPRLAEALLDAGDADAAKFVRNAIDRAPGESTTERKMLAARMEIDAGRPEKAAPELLDVVRQRTPDAGEALLLLMETREKSGEQVADGVLEQALALSFETEADIGEQLRLAVARSHVRERELGAAMEIIRSVPENPERARTLALLFQRIADAENDADFLTDAVKYAAAAPDDTKLRLRIAERLIENQLIEPARAYLDTGDAIPTRAERVLRGRIAALEGKPRIAESYIAGLDGGDVEPIRESIATLDVSEEPAPVEVEPVPTEARDEPELARKNREMIERSAALRKELSGLLGE